MTMNKHDRYCEDVVKGLEALFDGEVGLIDGELAEIRTDDNGVAFISDGDRFFTEDGNPITVDGEEIATEDDFDALNPTLWDYLGDVYDIDWICDSNKEYKACRLMIACGGPNVYINTWDKCVELHWWNENGKAWIPSEVCEQIDDQMREWWHC